MFPKNTKIKELAPVFEVALHYFGIAKKNFFLILSTFTYFIHLVVALRFFSLNFSSWKFLFVMFVSYLNIRKNIVVLSGLDFLLASIFIPKYQVKILHVMLR